MLDFLISNAHAQNAAPAAGPDAGLINIGMLVLLMLVFYFLLIRPQTKRAKEHKAMVSAIAKGDEVVTNGGLIGKVREVGENIVNLEVADNVQIKVQKASVANTLPKGSIDNM